ncbi:MAG: nitroreductase family protein [Lachnospiraceae bacterium]|nr:nitroreductase family protein [Lachnospiraceae bacterium]
MSVIETRTSVRTYTDEPVGEEEVRRILNAGFSAPSAKNIRPYEFIVVTDRKRLERLADTGDTAAMLKNAALAIAVIGDTGKQPAAELLIADCAAVTENMLLRIEELGLGGCWCGILRDGSWYPRVREVLGLPAHMEPVSLIAVGHARRKRRPKDRFEEEKLHYDVY